MLLLHLPFRSIAVKARPACAVPEHRCWQIFRKVAPDLNVIEGGAELALLQELPMMEGESLAGAQRLELWTFGFGDRRSTN